MLLQSIDPSHANLWDNNTVDVEVALIPPAPSLLPPAVVGKFEFTIRELEETPFWFKRVTEASRARE